MINIILFVTIVFSTLVGCSTNEVYLNLKTRNKIKSALNKRNVWAEVLVYTSKQPATNKETKKCVVIFKYPTDTSYIRSYDHDGSYLMYDFHKENRILHPLELAAESERIRNNTAIVTKAEFINTK